MIWPTVRAALFQLDPERAHRLAHAALHGVPAAVARAAARAAPPAPSLATRCFGLDFAGPVGLAAGFDKGEVSAAGLFALGFSHVEIGTITPRPQPGNDRPRLFRLVEHRALVNRMGFNNAGAEACAARLAALPASARLGPVGVNVGRNKATSNAGAAADYLACIERLHPFADYLVVNISSPNTPGLRQLQEKDQLGALLGACRARLDEVAPGKPLLVKLAPDLEPDALDEAVDVAIAAGVSGIVATNTTLSRAGVERHPLAREAGGLSGAPLAERAAAVLRRCYARAAGRIPIVGSGGIMDPEGAYARIRAGAALVQVYTGLIYGGPTLVRRMNDEIARFLARDGFATLAEAVGADHRAGDRAQPPSGGQGSPSSGTFQRAHP